MVKAFQDMPPPGGFGTINVDRTFAKPLVRQALWGLVLLGMTVNGMVYLKKWFFRHRVERIECSEHFIATEPFIMAEQERKFLLHLYNLREEERELMKDHPNWKVGTLYGEKVYKSLPDNVIPPLTLSEYGTHRTAHEILTKVIKPDWWR